MSPFLQEEIEKLFQNQFKNRPYTDEEAVSLATRLFSDVPSFSEDGVRAIPAFVATFGKKNIPTVKEG